MKTSRKLIAPIACLALMGAVVVGTTAAWWSSSESANINISVGEIKIGLEFDNVQLYSLEWDETNEEYVYGDALDNFAGGGGATITQKTNTSALNLAITTMASGDKVTVDVNVKNTSSIASKLYLKMTPVTNDDTSATESIADDFVVALTDEDENTVTFDSTTNYSEGIVLDAFDNTGTATCDVYKYTLSISLPQSVTTGMNGSYSFSIEALATQVNAELN